jgi:hypothetical protein
MEWAAAQRQDREGVDIPPQRGDDEGRSLVKAVLCTEDKGSQSLRV